MSEILDYYGGEHEEDTLVRCCECSFVEVDRRFIGAYSLHHQDDLKFQSNSTRLHDAVSQKTVIFSV
jgi:hypothetical protein